MSDQVTGARAADVRRMTFDNNTLLAVLYGNHDRNPPDGSNWENLCVYCHEAEHTTHTLGDYLTGRDRLRDRDR